MRIGYIVSRYPAVSHAFIQREVLGLRKLGWSVSTLSIRRTPQKELLTPTDIEEAKATFVVVPPSWAGLLAAIAGPCWRTPGRVMRTLLTAWRMRGNGIRGAFWALFYFVEALLVHRHCRRERLAHLHAHFANVAGDVAMLAAILNGGTFSFTMHGPTEFFAVREHRLAEKTAAAKCVICISDFARSQLMTLLPPELWGKLEVVHCGVDPDQFSPPAAITSFLPRSRPVDRPVADGHQILCVARLAEVKGHAILMQAIAELLLRGHAVTATFIGDGPLRQALERRAEVLGIGGQVRFLGSIGQDVIQQHYAKADLFVLPSFAEGVPVVLMEAMAARCPVIATRIAGIPELIEHGTTGLLVPPGRADLLTDAMERLLMNPLAAARMAQCAYDKVQREFNIGKVAPQLAAIFQKHLTPKSPAWVATPIDARHRAADHRAPTRESPPSRSRRLPENPFPAGISDPPPGGGKAA